MLPRAGLFLSIVSLLGCAPVDADDEDRDDEQATSTDTATAGLGCVELFDCLGPCTDNACSDDCVARASQDGLAAANALADCAGAAGCADDACLQAQCPTELATCVGQSQPPPGGNVPPGNVPAELVGSWAGADAGTTRRLILGADGSASWQVGYTSDLGNCLKLEMLTYQGSAVFGATDFTFNGSSAAWTVFECNKKTSETPESAKSWTSPYQMNDANTMRVVDLSNCPPEYDAYNQAVYCSATLTRE